MSPSILWNLPSNFSQVLKVMHNNVEFMNNQRKIFSPWKVAYDAQILAWTFICCGMKIHKTRMCIF